MDRDNDPILLAEIILELALTRRDLVLRLNNECEQTIENLMIRFNEEQTKRFLNHIEQGLKK